LPAFIPTDFKHPFIDNTDFDLVALFEIQSVNDGQGQSHGEAIAPFRDLHGTSLFSGYTLVIVYHRIKFLAKPFVQTESEPLLVAQPMLARASQSLGLLPRASHSHTGYRVFDSENLVAT
jgi:hypothetical protein